MYPQWINTKNIIIRDLKLTKIKKTQNSETIEDLKTKKNLHRYIDLSRNIERAIARKKN